VPRLSLLSTIDRYDHTKSTSFVWRCRWLKERLSLDQSSFASSKAQDDRVDQHKADDLRKSRAALEISDPSVRNGNGRLVNLEKSSVLNLPSVAWREHLPPPTQTAAHLHPVVAATDEMFV
jgi:hypothetical protein